MKELFKITQIKDSVVQVEAELTDEKAVDLVASGIVSAMAASDKFAQRLTHFVSLYWTNKEELVKVIGEAKKNGKKIHN